MKGMKILADDKNLKDTTTGHNEIGEHTSIVEGVNTKHDDLSNECDINEGNDSQLMDVLENLPAFPNNIYEINFKSFKDVVDLSKNISEKMNDFFESINMIIETFPDSFNLPDFSQESQDELTENSIRWGKYGWTLAPHQDFSPFNFFPKTQEIADNYMTENIKVNEIESLFKKLLKIPNINQNDLLEAIANYRDARYKSSIMMLFSMMDGEIIKIQDPYKNRKTGKRGFSLINQNYEKELEAKQAFFTKLHLTNTTAAINTMYAKGRNFKEQPNVANRNFVHHGMLERELNKKDAIQIFLLTYNVLHIINKQ